MAAEWLRADQVAALAAGHHEVLTTFTDVTGRTNTLREGCCVKCGARWPCLAAQWAAQDGRWRALVGLLTVYGRHRPYCSAVPADACMCGWGALQMQAQAALDGAAGEG